MKKDNKEKIRNKITIIAVILLVPLVINAWVPYLWPNIPNKLMDLITKITTFSFVCSLLLFSTLNNSFIEKQIEDKKLKNGNYKFKYKEQFFRYVHPDVIKIALIMVYFPILIFIRTKIYNMGIINKEMIDSIMIGIGYVLFVILYTIWVKYCDGFNDKKETKKYIVITIIGLIIAIIIMMGVKW